MRKNQKYTLVLTVISVFMATALFLPGLTDAGDVKLDDIYDIVLDTNTMVSDINSKLMPVPVEKTGQTETYATGDDGDLEKGVVWPIPRFTDNADGTVTDNLTGLIWLKNANCFGQKNWNDALNESNGLADGDCELTDGSVAGDWRLPNIKELQSLIHYGVQLPALPNTDGTGKWAEGDPFNAVQFYGGYYWLSTTSAIVNTFAWRIFIEQGYVDSVGKENDFMYVWPVR